MSESDPTWGSYLRRLAEDGVRLGECEEEAVRDDGQRVTTKFLERVKDGYQLHIPIKFDDLSETVPWYKRRQIANALRLPAEKYIFPDTP